MRILAIDDYPSVLIVLEYLLTGHGHSVFCARDGRTGLRLAAEVRPDLLLVDFDMPEFGGLEVLHALRGDSALTGLPAIIMTGRPTTEVVRRSLAAGARAVLAQPFDFSVLQSVLGAQVPIPETG